MPAGSGLARALLPWFRLHGRHELPWRRDADPYRVWVSEIMLQQTRVAAALPYYGRFLRRFPTLRRLAAARLDRVLHLWSGLGYYARARNLHRAAGILVRAHGARLPRELAGLMALPGIGRSTAGAILSFGYGVPAPILDGNARRVLIRYHGITNRHGRSAMARLWSLAEAHLPATCFADHNQAIMDLGALVCTPRAPRCPDCPLQAQCRARQRGTQASLPAARPARPLPLRQARFLLIRDPQGRVYLERRPPTGVWGGLWAPPECPPACRPARWAGRRLGLPVRTIGCLPEFTHTFSHFRLQVEPILLLAGVDAAPRASADVCWMAPARRRHVGLAAPVSRLFAIMRDRDREGKGK